MLGHGDRLVGQVEHVQRVTPAGLGAAVVAHRRRGRQRERCGQDRVGQCLALSAEPVEHVARFQPRRLDLLAGAVDVGPVVGGISARGLRQLRQLHRTLPDRDQRALGDPLLLQLAGQLLDRRAPPGDGGGHLRRGRGDRRLVRDLLLQRLHTGLGRAGIHQLVGHLEQSVELPRSHARQLTRRRVTTLERWRHTTS